MSTEGVLSHFGNLDELAQVVYQGFERFVILSKVDSSSWTIHLGLLGSEGRWWRGSCSGSDILNNPRTGPNASDAILETFASQLTDALRKGELHVGGWSTEKGAQIFLSLGSEKTLLRMPLVELSQPEAASYATSIIFEVAKEAQSRKCQLHPSPYSVPPARGSVPPAPSTSTAKPFKASPSAHASSSKTTTAPPGSDAGDHKAQDEIKALKAELEIAKHQKKAKSPPVEPNPKTKRPPKGASLANPNKKARKYQELEFASNDDN